MNRLERALGIVLLLRNGKVLSAAQLAERFEVSVRTIYRDIDVLSGLGIPVTPEMGRTGGFRLLDGYFLPPVGLGPEEAMSLLLGLSFMKALRVMPFPAEADFAERKLLAVLPADTRTLMERVSRMIGFEKVPPDLLHPERDDPIARDAEAGATETAAVGRFLRAILSKAKVRLSYRSPYRNREEVQTVDPRGLVWDRDRWYLVGDTEVRPGEPRMWRSDRVLETGPGPSLRPSSGDFDVTKLLGRRWLGLAMERWREASPVRIALTADQAERLKRDWYYGHAEFGEAEGRTVMTIGEDDRENVAALVRWLGPGAELLEPAEWRPYVADTLRRQAKDHED